MREYTVEQLESQHMFGDESRGLSPKPFGFAYSGWLQFKSKIQPGDIIHDFHSSPESWKHLAGQKGYLLVRNGEVIDTFITLMS